MKKLGFGCMRFPMQGQEINKQELAQMVDLFMERGFTYFDTSYVYHGGESEKLLKDVLVERYPRESFTITTKSPVFLLKSRQHFFEVFQEQLDRLGTDYVDYYWLHAVNGDVYQKAQEMDLFTALMELKSSGRTRHIGFSYHDSPELLDQILTEHPEVEYVQLQLNYFDWDSPYVAARGCYEVCKRHGKLVVVMEPVKGGVLATPPEAVKVRFAKAAAEASPAQLAVRFCASLDHVFMVLSGMSTLAQMEENTAYMSNFQPLTAEEEAAVAEAAELLRDGAAYPAESLDMAQQVCPKHIGLVKIAQMLNDHQSMNGYSNTCIYYAPYLGSEGKAEDCDSCGKCLPLAGGVDIPAMLKEAQDTITHF
ncbi:aldo/keto reductase [Intestinimonas butyriciproducens]|uniref:aldo/keto reductase n=1 Tax=Intestinimonas butyriciproducens TaxID=1297617 RepID=UPI0019571642|nr:aldo/keto reductase [Intestinimonas butyriciproducens]MBM6975974.1 aldo/keto reductase [Intestinimonas butyriciproducens]